MLSPEQLPDLEHYAELMFTVQQIAVILAVNSGELKFYVTEQGSSEQEYFSRGRLKAEASVRKAIYDLALNGSSPAQTQYLELIENAKLDDVL